MIRKRQLRRNSQPTDPRVFIAGLVCASFAVLGCPGELTERARFTMPDCPPEIDIVEDVFAPNCGSTACHGAGAESEGNLDLLAVDLPAQLVDVPSSVCVGRTRVDSSNLEQSFFIEKLGLDPECGDPMPRIGVRLSRVELACIQEWVESLTPEADGGSP